MSLLFTARRFVGPVIVPVAFAVLILPVLAQSPAPPSLPSPTPVDPLNQTYRHSLTPLEPQQAGPSVPPGPKPDLPQNPCGPLNMVRTLTQANLCGTTFNDTLEGRANRANVYNTDPPCASCHDANEAVYMLEVDQPTQFGAGLAGFYSAPWGLFVLPDTCRADQTIAGGDGLNTGSRILLPGRYYLVVDSWSRNNRFQVSTACPFTKPQTSLAALPTSGTPITGNNSSGQNRVAWYGTHPKIGGVCSTTTGQSAPEVVYTLDIAQARQVGLTLTIQGGADLNLFLLRNYDNTDCVAMSAQTRGSTETIGQVLDPGRYYVVVDGTSGATADFSLKATLGPVTIPQQVQPERQQLVCNTTVSGDTSRPELTNKANRYSCLSYEMPEPELAYRFELPVTATVSLLMTPTANFDYSTILRHVDLLLLDDTSTNSCVTFSNNTQDLGYAPSPDWIQRVLGPGTYYAVVDGAPGQSGNRMPFELTLACQAAGPDSVCALIDSDGDGIVAVADLKQLATQWRAKAPDLNGDGRSDVADLMWAARFWNLSC